MSHDVLVTIVAHVTILLTTVAGFVFTWFSQGRRHRWQQEENEKMRSAVNAIATEVRNGNGGAH